MLSCRDVLESLVLLVQCRSSDGAVGFKEMLSCKYGLASYSNAICGFKINDFRWWSLTHTVDLLKFIDLQHYHMRSPQSLGLGIFIWFDAEGRPPQSLGARRWWEKHQESAMMVGSPSLPSNERFTGIHWGFSCTGTWKVVIWRQLEWNLGIHVSSKQIVGQESCYFWMLLLVTSCLSLAISHICMSFCSFLVDTLKSLK